MRRLLVVALLLLLLPAAPAHAQEFRSTVSPERPRYGEDQQVTWRIAMRTGEQPVRFTIALSPSAGLLVLRTAEVTLEGMGTMQPGPQWHDDDFGPCGIQPVLPWRRGALHAGAEYVIELPADAQSTLVVPTHLAAVPWATSTYALNAVIEGAGSRRLELPTAVAGGRIGVPIELAGPRPDLGCGALPWHRPGAEKRIAGTTDPRIAGDRLTVRAVAPGSRSPVVVGMPRVSPRGTFLLTGWRPRTRGIWEIGVHYESQRPEILDDFAPAQAFRVGPPPVRPAGFFVEPTTPGSLVHGVVRCPRDAARCRGTLRLRKGQRDLAGRRFSVPSGATRRLPLRLPRAASATVRRDGELRVRVELDPERGPTRSQVVLLRRRAPATTSSGG